MSTSYQYIYGTESNDFIGGTYDDAYIYLYDGDDKVYTYGGYKVIDTGLGNDQVISRGAGFNEIYTGAGTDLVTTSGSDNFIDTGSGDDTVSSSGGNNIIFTGLGNDFVVAFNSMGMIDTGSGNDRVFAMSGQQIVDLGDGNDHISATSGHHDINGGAGDDTIYGVGTLDGGAGSDFVKASSGANLFIYNVLQNYGAYDQYIGAGAADHLELRVDYALSIQPWFQQAMDAFDLHVNQNTQALFDFSSFDLDGEYFNLQATGFESYSVLVENKPEPTTPLSLSVADAEVVEGDHGLLSWLSFEVSLDRAAEQVVSFDYTLSGLSASSIVDQDFIAESGHVEFDVGQDSVLIQVPVFGDHAFELNETLALSLFNVQGAEVLDGKAIGTIIDDDQLNEDRLAVPIFNSNLPSTNVIYLDFDGEYLPDASPWIAEYEQKLDAWTIGTNPYSFTDTELEMIEQIWRRVAEDFAPFDVNITTDRAVYDAADASHRMHHILTSSDSSVLGEAFYNTWGDENNHLKPSLTFSNYYDKIELYANTTSHEIGHGFGLTHDGINDPGDRYKAYYNGHNEWSPLMGGGPYDFSQWSQGEYNYATNHQDDIAILRDKLGSRADDHADELSDATWLHQGEGLAGTGVIESREDVDVFKISGSNHYSFNIYGLNHEEHGTNLDIGVRVKDAAGDLLAEYMPSDSLNVIFEQEGNETIFLEVFGTGNADPLTTGYSDYGSLGFYHIDMMMTDLAEGEAVLDYIEPPLVG